MYKPFQLADYSLTYRTCTTSYAPKFTTSSGGDKGDGFYYYSENDNNAGGDKGDGYYYYSDNDNNAYGDIYYGSESNSPSSSPSDSPAVERISYVYFMMCPSSSCPSSSNASPQNCAVYVQNLDDYLSTYIKYTKEKLKYFCAR